MSTRINNTLPLKLLICRLRSTPKLTISLNNLATELAVTNRGVCYIIEKLKRLGIVKVSRAVHAPNTYELVETEENMAMLSTILKDIENDTSKYTRIF